MRILSHRGYWLDQAERNTEAAFARSFALGFGTETDLRDHEGRLVVAHDPPMGGEMPIEALLALLPDPDMMLAVNIKADGLAAMLATAMRDAGHRAWFTFDMSVPDMVAHRRLGLPYFVRASDFEPEPGPLAADAAGVWLDAFGAEWWDAATVQALAAATRGGQVCVVSPELHGRAPQAAWRALRPVADIPGLMLCTDLPEHAARFFAAEVAA